MLSTSRKLLSLGCLAFLLVAFSLTGCDSESLLSGSGSANTGRALHILGPEGMLTAYADVQALNDASELWVSAMAGDRHAGEKHLGEMQSQFGLDIEEDIEAVYLSASRDRNGPDVGLLIYGDFDAATLIAALQSEDRLDSFSHDGPSDITAFRSRTEEALFVGISNGELIMIASSEERFRNMLSRSGSLDTESSLDDPLLDELRSYQSWGIASDLSSVRADMAELDGPARMIGPVLESIDRAGSGLRLSTDTAEIASILVPRRDVSPEDLANVLRGAVAAMRFQLMNADSDVPARVLSRISVETRSGIVRVSASVDRSEVEELRDVLSGRMN